ncbi:MAG: glycosyltransferase family 39 protein [Phycisphaerae bacterium]
MPVNKNDHNWFRFESGWWIIVILVAGLAVWSRQIYVGGFSGSDEAVYAMDGVFVFDFVKAHPAGAGREWAQNYFSRYPCLGIIVSYPPVFAMVEAFFYAIAGVSVLAARMSVLFFATAGVLAMYWVGRQLYDHASGVLAAGLWASLPSTVLWSRQVMLEVPATAMLLICCGCYLKYKSSRSILWLALTSVAMVLAVFTSQWAMFFGGVLIIDLIKTLKFKKAFSTEHTLAAGASLIVIGAYMVFTFPYAYSSKFLVRGELAWRHLISLDHWLFYIKALPDVLSWSMLGLAAVGFLISASTGQIKKLRIPLLWIVLFYLFASVIAYKETRYFYLITPAGVLLAVGGLCGGLEKTRLKQSGTIILGLVMVFQYLNGWRQNPDRLGDYEVAVRLILASGDANFVLVDATRDGQFVFDMRRLQGADGRVSTIRGSKLLYAHTESDVLSLIANYGISYIVVESGPPDIPNWQDVFPRPSQLLRKVLCNRLLFEKLASYPISENRIWNNVQMEVYRIKCLNPNS